jgi:hypothetical protein
VVIPDRELHAAELCNKSAGAMATRPRSIFPLLKTTSRAEPPGLVRTERHCCNGPLDYDFQ